MTFLRIISSGWAALGIFQLIFENADASRGSLLISAVFCVGGEIVDAIRSSRA